MSDIQSNCSENISNRDGLIAQLESLFKRQRCEAFPDIEQQEWVLPVELAFYANKYLQKLMKGKNLKESILNGNLVSTNTTKPWKLDEYYKELIEEYRTLEKKIVEDIKHNATIEKTLV